MTVEDSPQEAVADALRDVLRRLHEYDVPADVLRDARDRVRDVAALLDGPPRARWFERGITDGKSSRQARRRFADHSLYRGRSNALAPPLTVGTVQLPDGRHAVEGRVVVPRRYEGPPHGVHGGFVAGLFDDVLGGAQSLIEGPTGLTGTLTVRYRNLTPLDTELVFLGWVHSVSGRRIVARATCHAGDVLTAEAEALFVRVDMERLAGGGPPAAPRPGDWD